MSKYRELICIDTDITNRLILNKKYYGIDAMVFISSIKYIHIYNNNFNYIAPFKESRFITIEKFRDKRLNGILK